jgi:hypothetical protein
LRFAFEDVTEGGSVLLYIIGFNIYTGFVVIHDGEVRAVHASYTEPTQVVDETLAQSLVIRCSYRRGYFATPIFRDDRLVD